MTIFSDGEGQENRSMEKRPMNFNLPSTDYTPHTSYLYMCLSSCVYTHTHTQFMDYFFVNSSCPWQNANNVQISYWVNYQINSWTAFVYIISDARNPQILSVSNSPDWPETCSNPPLSLWSTRIRGTKCYMTSYNLSSVVAIAKKNDQ